MFIPDYIKTILGRFSDSGTEAYLVGGCVRDFILGRTPGDFDIAAGCLPAKTKELFSDYSVIETGVAHGTVTVVAEHHPVEITTFRIDGEYADNRHPEKVVFSGNIKDDLSRRDFTVNAMAYNEKNGLVDLFGGVEDARSGIIRCVGEPSKRFNEDGLRILRALRFASVLDFKIEEKTALSIEENRFLLRNISAERIFAELKKFVSGPGANRVLETFSSVFDVILPGAGDKNGNHLSLPSSNTELSLPLNLAFLLKNCPSAAAENTLCSLKTDNKTRAAVMFLLENREITFGGRGEFLRFAGACGIKNAALLLDFRSLLGEDVSREREILNGIKDTDCLTVGALAVNGRDLSALGIRGRKTGEMLRFLLTLVTDGTCENEKEALTGEIIKKMK